MTQAVIFAPLVPLWLLWAAVALALAATLIAAWRGLSGWWLRGLAGAALCLAIANPSLQREEREPLSDIVLAVIDDSASQRIGDRPAQSEAALEHLRAEVAALGNTELREVHLGDGADNAGTLAMAALSSALAEEPQGRIAGAVLITDGQVHDADRPPRLPAPLHVLLTGHAGDWDRQLSLRNAPAFAIIGEPVTLTLRLDDVGAGVQPQAQIPLSIAIDGAAPLDFVVPAGQDIDIPVTLPHGGMNVLEFSTPAAEGELTDRNNFATVQINGVRDRLRVLLVSGEPHPGERTWRNLLKSDSAVDLVHFTILRPPEKQDGVPVEELSLIAFPTRELFLEKIDEFDLIIFDRYRRRGILPDSYFDNIRAYIEKGGAVLVSAGPEYGSADSIYRSPLGAVLPGQPTARVLEQAYVPQISALGARHPVTEGLADLYPRSDGASGPGWGRWMRLIDVVPAPGAEVVMTGPDDRPLLMLDRVGEGRVGLIASDQSWLWDRGFEGGGPQLELLRRLAHWMMKEPELEEEALWAEPLGQSLRIIRRTLGDGPGEVSIRHPDGSESTVALTPVAPGRFEALWPAPDLGLYRLSEGGQTAVIAVGPAAPREFERTLATGDVLQPVVDAYRGGVMRIEDGLPDLRSVRAGRLAAGRGWIAVTPRGAWQTAEIQVRSLLPAWAFLLLAALLILGAWLREARR